MSTTVVVQIGNSDDKLSQRDWSAFYRNTLATLKGFGEVHFAGASHSAAEWQNACFVIALDVADVVGLRANLEQLAHHHRQNSIALTVGETEFVGRPLL